MHLLSRSADSAFKLTTFHDDKPPPYAILSHTWGEEEVTYADLVAGTGDQKAGYEKLRFCAEKAAADGLEYFWVDTCCIDKSLGHELSTAINSMFRWYQRAVRCYVYLVDASFMSDMSDTQWRDLFVKSRWFTRGWTLQELIASSSVDFYSKGGHYLGNRMSLEAEIHSATGIPLAILRGHDLSTASHEEKLKWVKSRTTTLKEDKAYCMLGLFGVYLPLIYGEGEDHAFDRLAEEIERQQRRSKGRELKQLPHPLNSILPFERCKDFIGRTESLAALSSYLLPLQGHKRFRIGGWNGAGKTTLAVEFAHRVVEQYPRCQVFWLSARSLESFKSGYREIATILGAPLGRSPEGKAHRYSECLENIGEYLSQRYRNEWLMIVDDEDYDGHDAANADDAVDYRAFLPWSGHGAIIFISLGRSHASSPKEMEYLMLRGMQLGEAVELIKRHTVSRTLLGPQAEVNQMLKRIDCIPAAIVRASAHINEHQISPSDYIVRINDNSNKFPGARFEALSVWKTTLSHLSKRQPQTIDALALLAHMDHTNLKPSLFEHCGIDTAVGFSSTLRLLENWGLLLERVEQQDARKFPHPHPMVPPSISPQSSSYYLCTFFGEALVQWIDDEYGKQKAIQNLQLVIRTQFRTQGPDEHESFVPHARSLLRFRDHLSIEATLELLALVACHDVEFKKTRISGSQLVTEIVDIIAKSQGDDFILAIPTLLDLADCLQRVDRVAEAEKVLRLLLPAWSRPLEEHFGMSVNQLARPKPPPDEHLTDLMVEPFTVTEEAVVLALAQLERRKNQRLVFINPETWRLQKLLWLRMKEKLGPEHMRTLHCSIYMVRDLVSSGELETARILAQSTQLQLCQLITIDERWYWETILILTYYLEKLGLFNAAVEMIRHVVGFDGLPSKNISAASARQFQFSLSANAALCAQEAGQQERSVFALKTAANALTEGGVAKSPHAWLAAQRVLNEWRLFRMDGEPFENWLIWQKAVIDLHCPCLKTSLWHYDWQAELDAVAGNVNSSTGQWERRSLPLDSGGRPARVQRSQPPKPAKLSTGAKTMRWIKD